MAHGDRRFSAICLGLGTEEREEGDGVTSLQGAGKVQNTDSVKKKGIHGDSVVLSVGRVVRPPAGQRGKQWEPRGAVIMSPLSVRAVRTFGECQQPELRGEPEKGTCQSRHMATNHEQSQPPGTFPWSRLLRGPLVPPYVVKVELANESCPQAKEREEHLPVALRAFSHTGPTCFA